MKPVELNYRTQLRETLEERCQKNPRYSLRAFARDLNISAPRLSRILNRRHGLSVDAARTIAARLDLSRPEQELFCALVESEHGRASISRATAKKRASELAATFKSMSIDSFRFISDWYHLAILELTLVEGFKSQPAWIAQQIGITQGEASAAVERLLRMNLLENDQGTLRATGDHFINPLGTPSDAVRKFHAQILSRAQQALEFQTVEEREFSNLIVALDDESLPRVRELIREFTYRINKEVSNCKPKTRIYNLSIQFFGLQERPRLPHNQKKKEK